MSIWADLQDRCSGEVIRKEDDVNHLSTEAFAEYIKEHYIVSNPMSDQIRYEKMKDFSFGYIVVPIFRTDPVFRTEWGESTLFLNNFNDLLNIEFALDIGTPYNPIPLLKKKFIISTYINNITTINRINLFPKDMKPVTNQFFLEVLDYIIENGDKDMVMLKKKEE